MSLEQSQELKGLESQLAKINGELTVNKGELQSINRAYDAKLVVKKNIEDKIRKLKSRNNKPTVSEHAIIQYLQRVKGVDINAITHEILTENLKHQIQVCGNCKVPSTVNNVRILTVVKNNTVVTVAPNDKK